MDHLHSFSFTMLHPYLRVIFNYASQHEPALGTTTKHHSSSVGSIFQCDSEFGGWRAYDYISQTTWVYLCPWKGDTLLPFLCSTDSSYVYSICLSSTTSSLKASMSTPNIYWGVFPVVALWYPQLYWKIELEMWNEIKILCATIETEIDRNSKPKPYWWWREKSIGRKARSLDMRGRSSKQQ
jgi:hypothetical protein